MTAANVKRYYVRNGDLFDEQADTMYVKRHEVVLATEYDALAKVCDERGMDIVHQQQRINALLLECQALRKDAERYKIAALRPKHLLSIADGLEEYGGVLAGGDDAMRDLLTSAERALREVIDAALAARSETCKNQCDDGIIHFDDEHGEPRNALCPDCTHAPPTRRVIEGDPP